MKINLEELSKLERKLNIEVPLDRVATAFENAYKQFQKKADIKGFRKGKAPLETIKKLYEEKVKSNVLQDLVQEYFFQAVQDKELNPINQPRLSFDQFDEAQPFSFSAEFEVHPDVQLKKYENLEVQKEQIDLDPKHIDSTLENIQTQNAEHVPMLEDRGAQIGDIAVIDFEGFIDGAPLEGGKGENHPLELGSNSFIPGFEEHVVGMKAGNDKTANLNFPEDYHVAQLAGKAVDFKINLKEIKKKNLPELNDDFAKKVGMDSLDKLKEAIETDYKMNEEKRVKEDLKNRLLKELANQNPVDVPKSMLEEQKKVLIDDMKQRMHGMGMSDENFKEYIQKWDGDLNETATFIVQSSYLINAVAKKENLLAQDADIQERIEGYVQQSGLAPEKVRSIYDNPENKSRLQNVITEEKVVDFLSGKATVSEVPKDKLKDTKA